MSVLRSRSAEENGSSAKSSYREDGWSSTYPGVWEMLSAEKLPDGRARQTATLMIFCQDGSAKLCLHDRETGEVAWTSGAGMQEALERLEAGLQSGTLEWRKKKPDGKRK